MLQYQYNLNQNAFYLANRRKSFETLDQYLGRHLNLTFVLFFRETKHKKPVIKSNKEVNKLSKELSADVKLLRLQVAKRNRTVAAVHRQIDDVPNRPELAQYQRRFLELYSQG
jgi:hypothetical protein